MPIVKEYKDNPGYYIHARPPDTGNINYKIKSEAYSIIESCGLRHEDEITWDMIRSMKSLGFIYTDSSGVLDVGEFEPDPDQLKETTLSRQKARELLATIQKHRDLTQEELETICSILGIEVPESDLEALESRLNTVITSLVKTEEFPISSFIMAVDRDFLSVRMRSSDRLDRSKEITIHIEIVQDYIAPSTPDGEYVNDSVPPDTAYIIPTYGGVSHNISVTPREGITDWIVAFGHDISWSIRSEALRQVGQLIPLIVEELENAGMEPGRPEDLPDPMLKSSSD
ncbi:hypothetical protein [Halococcus sediminicola]|uniref:hypothetical protein n=1 Tax=Halococcus sediminicola TaxID=1264579 RepID=UPI0012AB78D7|nr:hypothetical protein [Halococcus sediminicola]